MDTIHRSPSSPSRLLQFLAAALMSLAAVAGAQESNPTASPASTAAAAEPATKIPIAQIPARVEDTTATLRAVRTRLAPEPRVEQIRRELADFAEQLDEMEADLSLRDPSLLGARTLDDLQLRWQSADRVVRSWDTLLAERARTLDQQLANLASARAPWERTLADKEADRLPDALAERIESLLGEIGAVETETRERLDAVLTVQNRVSERLVAIGDALSRIDQAEAEFRDQMLIRVDGPPLWKIFAGDESDVAGDMQQQLGQGWRDSLATSRAYLEDYPDRIMAVVLFFLVLAGLLLVVRARRLARHAREGEDEDVIDVLSRPIASALLLSLILALFLFTNAPIALRELLRLAIALPVFLLMRRVVPEEVRLPVYAVIGLFVLDVGGGIIARRPEFERLLDLLVAGLALGVLLWTLRPGGWASAHRGGNYWRIVLLLLKAAAVLLTVAIVANVAGALNLSALLTDGTLASAYAGLGWYAILLVLQGLMDVILGSSLAARSQGISHNAATVKANFERLTNLLGALAWVSVTLRAFRLSDPVWDGLKTLFLTSITIGNFEISLSDVAAFVVALWAGFLVSRILRFILAEDVYPRVDLPRGVPSAISAMAHYAVLTIAFFVALAVAGIELGKFAIIAGALGVGIGFGLQNVVNNFVSGLILLFERPIQAGDAVELGPLFGRVVRIGIRSSTVRTYQGAEVIVPNADLISKEVINWTLSDSHRRLEVPVGVAYSSDPKQIIEILLAAGHANKEVMKEPEPFVVFTGYGASSLDFELRCWVQSYAEGLRIKTDLFLDIWYRLKEVGVEIPFPQQDLHLRTVDGEAAATLAGRPLPAPVAAGLVRPPAGPADRPPQRAASQDAEPSGQADADEGPS